MGVAPNATVLPNGITVLTVSVPGEPAAVYLRAGVGSAHERSDEHGATHLLEHLLFKGSEHFGIGAAARCIEGLGGDLNAWTAREEMVVHAEVAGRAWREAMEVCVDLMARPLLDPADLGPERLVVLEEISASEDDPDDLLDGAVAALVWPDHPYGRHILGTPRSLRALTSPTMRRIHQRLLAPSHTTLVVVGDVAHGDVVDAFRPHVAAWPDADTVAPVTPPPAAKARATARVKRAFDDRLVQVAWQVAPDLDDRAALYVLAGLLGGQAGDRISEILDDDDKLGFGGWCDLQTLSASGAFSLGFHALPGATEEALEVVTDLVGRVGRRPGGRDVARARETRLADMDFSEQTVGGIADDLLHHHALTGDPNGVTAWRHAVAAVTPESVAHAAARWLPPKGAVLGVLDPEVDVRAAQRAVRWAPPKARSGRLDTTVHGVRVIVAPQDVPVVGVRLLAPGGALRIPSHKAGLGAAWARMVHRGAGPYDRETLSDVLDDLAADLQVSDGLESVGLSATAPAVHATDLLSLLGEIALDPHLEEDDWSRVREEMLDGIRTRQDRAQEVVGHAIATHRFRDHPWSMWATGTNASLASITPKALRRFHDDHLHRDGLVVVVGGGIDADAAVDALDWLQDLPEHGRAPTRPPWPAFVPGEATVRAGTRQAMVTLTLDALPRGHADLPALQLAHALLDGQAGHLFLQLREARGLAYDVWATLDARTGGGIFHAGLATDPKRVEEASTALRHALVGFAATPPSVDDLDHARKVLLGRTVLDEQRVEVRVARLARDALYGLDSTPEIRRRRLARVKPADVARAMARIVEAGWIEIRSLPRNGS